MSYGTAITYLTKIFSKISVVFGLFFAVLAIAYSAGIISGFWFETLFLTCLFLVLLDLIVKFVCSQDNIVHLHKLEKKWITANYDAYRKEHDAKSKDNFQAVLESLGRETLTTLLSQTQDKLKEVKGKKSEKKLLKRLEVVQARKAYLESISE
jgi:hypothetical protein